MHGPHGSHGKSAVILGTLWWKLLVAYQNLFFSFSTIISSGWVPGSLAMDYIRCDLWSTSHQQKWVAMMTATSSGETLRHSVCLLHAPSSPFLPTGSQCFHANYKKALGWGLANGLSQLFNSVMVAQKRPETIHMVWPCSNKTWFMDTDILTI